MKIRQAFLPAAMLAAGLAVIRDARPSLLGAPESGRPAGTAADPGIGEYLRGNQETLDVSDRGRNFHARLLDASGKQIFLLGEVHGVARNNDVDLALLEELHRVAGVRTYLAEISHAQACELNRYLDTGEARILDFIFAQMRGKTVDCSNEKRQFWIDLRTWNAALAPGDRVRIVGVDLERFPGISLGYLAECLRTGGLPASLRALGPRIDEAKNDPTNAVIQNLVNQITRSLANDRADAASRLGGRFLDFTRVVGNLSDRCTCARDHAHYDSLRDRAMYENFRKIASTAALGKIYGRVGFAHVLQHRYDRTDWLSFYLNRADSPWAGRVVGIWPIYANSRRLALSGGNYGEIPCEDDPALVEPFAAAAGSDLVLFRLDRVDSPFRRQLSVPGGPGGGVTTDYVQYAVFMRHASADTPWRVGPPN